MIILKGKTVLITGATSGIGKASAIELARMGATIVFNTRDDARGESTKREIIRSSNNNNVEVLFCDLASIKSIRSFCKQFIKQYDNLHVLMNNAAIWDFHRRISKDGIENIFATNYIAPFLMTDLLLDLLKKSAPSRIINLTSGLHSGTINFDDIEFKKGFKGLKAYKQSKLGIILYTRLLAEKLKDTGITVNCTSPGMTKTNLARDAGRFSRGFFKLVSKPPLKGAETPIYLATSPEVENISGEYFVNKTIKRSSGESYDMALAKKLWDVGLKYTKNK